MCVCLDSIPSAHTHTQKSNKATIDHQCHGGIRSFRSTALVCFLSVSFVFYFAENYKKIYERSDAVSVNGSAKRLQSAPVSLARRPSIKIDPAALKSVNHLMYKHRPAGGMAALLLLLLLLAPLSEGGRPRKPRPRPRSGRRRTPPTMPMLSLLLSAFLAAATLLLAVNVGAASSSSSSSSSGPSAFVGGVYNPARRRAASGLFGPPSRIRCEDVWAVPACVWWLG